ncbi:hypothetical protein J6590_018210 [Homalodisca vitripennis]|nr:hypothetical protein J6590_018210 [Homalodisca vitripennis]
MLHSSKAITKWDNTGLPKRSVGDAGRCGQRTYKLSRERGATEAPSPLEMYWHLAAACRARQSTELCRPKPHDRHPMAKVIFLPALRSAEPFHSSLLSPASPT